MENELETCSSTFLENQQKEEENFVIHASATCDNLEAFFCTNCRRNSSRNVDLGVPHIGDQQVMVDGGTEVTDCFEDLNADVDAAMITNGFFKFKN